MREPDLGRGAVSGFSRPACSPLPDGRRDAQGIAQELEARGVRTPAGRDRWAAPQIARSAPDARTVPQPCRSVCHTHRTLRPG